MTNRGMMFLQPLFGGFSPMAVYCAVGAIRWVMADDGDAQSDDDGGRWGEATAEGRLYNRSPRLACLPGVGC